MVNIIIKQDEDGQIVDVITNSKEQLDVYVINLEHKYKEQKFITQCDEDHIKDLLSYPDQLGELDEYKVASIVYYYHHICLSNLTKRYSIFNHINEYVIKYLSQNTTEIDEQEEALIMFNYYNLSKEAFNTLEDFFRLYPHLENYKEFFKGRRLSTILRDMKVYDISNLRKLEDLEV